MKRLPTGCLRRLARLDDLPGSFVLVGDGEARARWQRVPPFGDRVGWLGGPRHGALPAIYAAADLLVWPACNEAYGMAMLEAQAAGVPVVAGPRAACRHRGRRLHGPVDRAALAARPLPPASARCCRTRSAGGAWVVRRRRGVLARHDLLPARRRRRRHRLGDRRARLPDPAREHELERGRSHPGPDGRPAEPTRAGAGAGWRFRRVHRPPA